MDNQGDKQNLLKPKIGILFMLAMAAGAIIGPWMVQMPWWFSLTGPSISLAFVAVALIMTPIIFCYGELVPMLPFAGGEYNFARNGLGEKTGWLVGWFLLWVYIMILAFMGPSAIRMGQVLFSITDISQSILTLTAIGVVLIFAIMNYFAITFSALVQFIMVTLLLVVGYVVGIAFLGNPGWSTENLTPFFTMGSSGWIVAAAIMMTTFIGFDAIPQMAEEAKYPRKKQMTVMFAAVWIAAILYVVVSLGNAGMMPTSWIVDQLVVSPEIAKMLWGPVPWVIINIAALATILTCINALMLAATRLIFAMGRSHVLPPALGHVNRYGSPDYALWFICIVTILIIAFAGEKWLEVTIVTSAVTMGIVYALTSLSAGILRKKHPEWPRPYRMPWGMGMAILGCIIGLAIAISAVSAVPSIGWLLLLIYIVIGAGIYFFMRHKRKKDESYREILLSPRDIPEEK
jgi:basic amino acid/polyamine antiporter, APA family